MDLTNSLIDSVIDKYYTFKSKIHTMRDTPLDKIDKEIGRYYLYLLYGENIDPNHFIYYRHMLIYNIDELKKMLREPNLKQDTRHKINWLLGDIQGDLQVIIDKDPTICQQLLREADFKRYRNHYVKESINNNVNII